MFQESFRKPESPSFFIQEEKIVRPQMPPCPNGCGNEEIRSVSKNYHSRLKDVWNMHHERDHDAMLYFYFCENCMSLFMIKKTKLKEASQEHYKSEMITN